MYRLEQTKFHFHEQKLWLFNPKTLHNENADWYLDRRKNRLSRGFMSLNIDMNQYYWRKSKFRLFRTAMIPTVWAKPKKFKLEIPSQTDVVEGETWRRVKAKVTRKQGFSRRDTSILIALLYFSAKTISVAGMLKHGLQFEYSTQKIIEAFKH